MSDTGVNAGKDQEDPEQEFVWSPHGRNILAGDKPFKLGARREPPRWSRLEQAREALTRGVDLVDASPPTRL